MLSPSRIVYFFIRLVLIYGLFILPWPGVRSAYASFYRTCGSLAFGGLVPGGHVQFQPLPYQPGGPDTRIQYVNLQTGEEVSRKGSSRNPAYRQTVFLISLILATPVSWRRKLLTLCWGLLLMHLAIFCKLFIMTLDGFSIVGVTLWGSASSWNKALTQASKMAVHDVVMLTLIPVFIWILVSFRRKDWMTWVQVKAQRKS